MREDGWITKAQVATKLQVDERTVERRARAGLLATRLRPGFPTLYSEADVEKLAQTTSQEVRTGILEAGGGVPANGHANGTALRRGSIPDAGLLVEVLHAIRDALAHGPTGPTGSDRLAATGPPPATGPTLTPDEIAAQWVTIADAAAIKGRTPTYLKRKIADGTLKAEKDRGWRIRRRDLESL